MDSRFPTGRHRTLPPGGGEYPQRPAPPPAPRSLAADVSAVEAAIAAALPEAIALAERRFVLKLQAEIAGQQSAAMTTLERRVKRRGAVAITLGTALGGVLLTFSTAWQVYRDAREDAVVPARKAEAKALELDARVQDNTDRLDGLEVSMTELSRDMGTLSRKLDRLLEAIDGTTPQMRRRP